MNKPFLWVALDELIKAEPGTLGKAGKLAELDRPNFGFKINIDWVLVEGLKRSIALIKTFSRPIFVDFKLFNGNRTVKNLIKQLVDLEVNLTNVHAFLDDQINGILDITKNSYTQVFALTVLSHHTEHWAKKIMGCDLKEAVRRLSLIAREQECDGVIAPAAQLPAISDILGIKKLATGIRPAWYTDDRHANPVSPAQLKDLGATDFVVGGPIMQASDPVEALKKCLAEL